MTLEYQFDQLCNKFREGSHATQANRRAMLKLFTEQLAKNGYDVKTMSPKDLKGRHVNKLLEQWRNGPSVTFHDASQVTGKIAITQL